jgi:hypothetical protein
LFSIGIEKMLKLRKERDMKPYPECTREMPELRQTIGRLFEQLPELENIEFTIGGQRYRARLCVPWVCMDVKADGRGWDCWTEWPLPEFYRRKAMGPNWQEQVEAERRAS